MKTLTRILFVFMLFQFLIACQSDVSQKKRLIPEPKKTFRAQAGTTKQIDTLALKLEKAGLQDVQSLDSTIQVELKYATTDNFTGKNMYGSLVKAYLQLPYAKNLAAANKLLHEINPAYFLKVWDAARPRSIQYKLWNSVGGTTKFREGFVANPTRGSLHNFGCAVDVTICNSKGTPIDMGTGFDFFGDKAGLEFEEKYLANGELSQAQVNNRKLLRKVMWKSGFTTLTTEWWHFNGCTIEVAKSKYVIVE